MDSFLSLSSLRCGKWDVTGAARATGLSSLWCAEVAEEHGELLEMLRLPLARTKSQKQPWGRWCTACRAMVTFQNLVRKVSVWEPHVVYRSVWTSLSCTNELFGVCYVYCQSIFLGFLVCNLLSLCLIALIAFKLHNLSVIRWQVHSQSLLGGNNVWESDTPVFGFAISFQFFLLKLEGGNSFEIFLSS